MVIYLTEYGYTDLSESGESTVIVLGWTSFWKSYISLTAPQWWEIVIVQIF